MKMARNDVYACNHAVVKSATLLLHDIFMLDAKSCFQPLEQPRHTLVLLEVGNELSQHL